MTMCKDKCCDQVCVLSPQVLGVCLLEKFLCPPGPEHGKKGIPEVDNKQDSPSTLSIPPPSLLSSSINTILQELVCRLVGLGNLWDKAFIVCKLNLNMW